MSIKKIAISTFSKFSYQICFILITFFLTPLMIKTLGDYKYGIWVLVNIIVNYYGYSELGITSAIERNLAVESGANNKENCKDIFINGMFLNIFIAFIVLLITFLSFIIVNFLQIKDYRLISTLILIMGISLGLSFPFKSFSTIITANIRFEICSGIMLFQLITNSIAMILLLLNGYGLVELALAALVTTLIANSIYIYFAYKIADYLNFDFTKINITKIKDLLKYSSKTFLAQIAEILRSKLDEVVTGSFISISAITPYSVANKLTGISNSFSLNFLSVLNPLFSSFVNTKTNEEKLNLFYFTSKFIISISFLIFCGFLLLGKPFIYLWLGPEYDNVYLPLVILALGYFVAYMQSVGVSYMYATNTHQYFAYMSIWEGTANLIFTLFFVLYLKLNIVGVALGTLIPISIIKIFVQPIILSKILQTKISEYYCFFIKNAIIGSAIYIPFGLLITRFPADSYLEIIVSMFAFILVAILHLLLMFNNKERELIKGYILKFLKLENLKNI